MELKSDVTELEYYIQWMNKYAQEVGELKEENQRLRKELEFEMNTTRDVVKQLLDCVELLYVIRDHYQVNKITTGEMIERIKELNDE